MRHSQFKIGMDFHTAAGPWRCTDIGTRVVVAVKLDAPDESWYAGPPYAIAEHVFDENDLAGCSTSSALGETAANSALQPTPTRTT
jgi:hypothetical protein